MLSESLNRTSITHMLIGNFDQAQTIGEEAFQIGRSSNNIDAQANSRNMVGWTYVEQGNMAAAQKLISEGISLGEPTGNVSILMFARADLGFIYAMLGAFERGIALTEAARALSESGMRVMRSWPAGILIRIYLLQGDVAAAASLAQNLGEYTFHRQQVRFMVPAWAQLGLGEAELAFAQHDYASSLLKIDSLIEHLREDGLDLFLPDALYNKGRTLLAQGMDRLENAQAVLREAQVKAEQIGSQRMLWPILASLSEIESRLGNKDRAQSLTQQAAEIVASIADQAGSPELRTSFLALPAVQRVLAGNRAQE